MGPVKPIELTDLHQKAFVLSDRL